MASLMANYYVHQMIDKKQTFTEFVLSCARNFGASITMKDDPMDAPIPDKFVPGSYYPERAAKARERLNELLSMNEGERENQGVSLRNREVSRQQRSLQTLGHDIALCQQMVSKVQQWTPPTPGHEGLKKFMLESIDEATRGQLEWCSESYRAAVEKDASDYYNEAVNAARESIQYNEEQGQEDRQRVAERNAWVRALCDSLK